jgi:hypothetical protein
LYGIAPKPGDIRAERALQVEELGGGGRHCAYG